MEWALVSRFAARSSKRIVATSRPAPTMAAVPSLSSRFPLPAWRRPMSDKTVIHVVDDDPAMRDSLAFLLDVNGFAPKAYESANAFLSGAAIELPTCVVSDIRMPGLSGVELVRELKGRGTACPVILITGH